MKNYIIEDGKRVPIIKGGFGGSGGGQSGGYNEEPNSLFSTDILFLTTAIGEGPIYRINPNGPQDIELNDSSIDDLIKINGNGQENTERFKTLSTTGTTTQAPLDTFGETSTTPQNFASPVNLKKGNVAGVEPSKVILQPTSSFAWDLLRFKFQINSLFKQEDNGDVKGHSVKVRVSVFDHTGSSLIKRVDKSISGKTNVPFKFNVPVKIPSADRNDSGYKFTIEKLTNESTDSRINSNIQIIGWDEVENAPQSYPRTAIIGYALKALNEHVGGIPNFTSLVKGLLVKVPANYNQPILSSGEIDWRQVELPESGGNSYTSNGYRLQKSGSTVLTAANPQIYVGTWDGTFVYSWTQNPVWIIYDILTNNTYGLGIPEDHIDKYKFYQIAQYCDAVDEITGNFIGVDGLADGSFRHKPRGKFTSVKQTLIGLSSSERIKQRRFVLDMLISNVGPTMDLINQISASFRGTVVYSFGKLSLAVDRPDQFPNMIFNETNIKSGTFKISGSRESEMVTGVDVSYIEPTNHYKREVVRIDTADANDGSDRSTVENILSLDLAGVTRRSQALRFAQYQIAATKYLRRIASFETSLEALSLSPGDLISISQNMTGVNYGFGGKVANNSVTTTNNNEITLEHFTFPALTESVFTANTFPVALRVIKVDSERVDLYVLSDQSSEYEFIDSGNNSVGDDFIRVKPLSRFNPITKTLENFTTFTANAAPQKGDLWSLGEWENTGDFYTNKAGKLFTVAEIERETQAETVTIVAKEYISNVYVDSDDFIDYTPTAYTDIESPFTPPPAPNFKFTKIPRRNSDGSIQIDGLIDNQTERTGYAQNYSTEFEISRPSGFTPVTNTHQSVLSVIVDNSSVIADAVEESSLVGKNGFTSPIGEVKLLCNAFTSVVQSDGSSNLQLTVEGLNVVQDRNFFKHLLEVNDGTFSGLKGDDFVSLPLREKTGVNSLKNFLSFAPDTVAVSANIVTFDLTNDVLHVKDTDTGGTRLSSLLPDLPFYVTINQLIDARFTSNNSFYLSGTEKEIILTNSIAAATSIETIDLPVRPRDKIFTRLYVDGIEKTKGQYTFNENSSVGLQANIQYPVQPDEDEGFSTYRVELDHYTVPTIELGDNVNILVNNTFAVTDTSYDPQAPGYNVQLTTNSIFRITIEESPNANLGGLFFTNITSNPTGEINNVSSNTATFDYDEEAFPGNFRLGNNFIYDLHVNSDFEQLFLTQDNLIKALPLGLTTVRARNINQFGRRSPFVEKSVLVENIPIQKVTDLDLNEVLIGTDSIIGIAIEAVVSFTHITGQEITEYEISHKTDFKEDEDIIDDLNAFSTSLVSATAVESDGKIRHPIQGLIRGEDIGANRITIKVVALNKTVRGAAAVKSFDIVGKTAPPLNVFNFTGGQQTDQITLFWEYERNAQTDKLFDLDLAEVIIKRIQGTVTPNLTNFIAGIPFVSVAAGVNRKSVPIDTFGTFTYMARTRDTSGNFSETVVGVTITTIRPARNTVIAAYNEDDPNTNFTDITNTNTGQSRFPAFSDVLFDGLVRFTEDSTSPGTGNPSTRTGNANASSSGFSAITDQPTDLLADANGTYITEIRDFGQTVSGVVLADISGSQSTQLTFFDQRSNFYDSSTETTSSGQLKDTSFGGIGSILGFSNTTFTGGGVIRFDSNNQTLMSGGSSGNVYAIELQGNYSGNVINISGITKASPAVITTSGSEHGVNHATGPVLTVDTISTNHADHTNGTYTGVELTDSGAGVGVAATVVVSSGAITSITITTGGANYAVNDTLTIPSSTIGGSGDETCDVATIDADFRAILHDIGGMVEMNNREIFLKRLSATTMEVYTDSGLSSALDSSGFTTYTSSGVVDFGDYANSNVTARIAGTVDASTIKLGEVFFANGDTTGGNVLANLSAAGSAYQLVDLQQFVDFGSAETFEGDVGAVTTQTFIRTTTAANAALYDAVDGTTGEAEANLTLDGDGNPNFLGAATNDGFVPYEAGTRSLRQFQLKFVVNNKQPDKVDFTLDKFRYTLERETVIFTDTVSYAAVSGDKSTYSLAVDISSANFTRRPVFTITPIGTVTAQTAFVTASSPTSVTFKLFDTQDNDFVSSPTGGSVTVDITATGV